MEPRINRSQLGSTQRLHTSLSVRRERNLFGNFAVSQLPRQRVNKTQKHARAKM